MIENINAKAFTGFDQFLHCQFICSFRSQTLHRVCNRGDAMGKTMLLSNGGKFEPFVVTGIAKNCPQNSSIKFKVLLPLKVSAKDESNNGNWFNSFLSTFIVLTPNANIKTVQNKIDKVFESDASESINEMKSKFGINNIGISYV